MHFQSDNRKVSRPNIMVTSQVWLEQGNNANTYGRDGFSIHGGWSKGSAGCIDIPWQTGKLNDYLDDCQDSVPLRVKYPEG